MNHLDNLRVLVTRPAGQSSALAEMLKAEGAVPILIPTIAIAPPASWSSLDAALASLAAYDWTIFTSANAVRSFAERAATLNLTPRPRRIAVVGPATARAVEEHLHQPADLIPLKFIAESLAEALLPYAGGACILLVRAAIAPSLLPDALSIAGADVTIAEAYRNIIPEGSAEALRNLFATSPPDAITFTSASTVSNLLDLLQASGITLPETVIRASIGPVTTRALTQSGYPPHVEAAEATLPALVTALAACKSLRT